MASALWTEMALTRTIFPGERSPSFELPEPNCQNLRDQRSSCPSRCPLHRRWQWNFLWHTLGFTPMSDNVSIFAISDPQNSANVDIHWMCETRVRVALKLFFCCALIDVAAVLSDGIRARAQSKDLMAVSCCTHTHDIYIYNIHIIYTDTECCGLMHVYHASTSQQCFVPAHFRVQKSYANIAAGLFPRQLHVHQWYWNYSTCNCCILLPLELRLSFLDIFSSKSLSILGVHPCWSNFYPPHFVG